MRHKADAKGRGRRYSAASAKAVGHAAIDAGGKAALDGEVVEAAGKEAERVALAIRIGAVVQAKIGARYSAVD